MGIAGNSVSITRRTYLWDEYGRPVITSEQSAIYAVKKIVDMMGRLMRSKGDLFKVSSTGLVLQDDLAQQFRTCLKADLAKIARHFPAHRHSPLFTIFKRFSAPVRFKCSGRLIAEDVAPLNAAVAKMRAFTKGAALGTALANMRRAERKNRSSTRELLHQLRQGYSKLLIIRLDLGYFSKILTDLGFCAQDLPISEVQRHRDAFVTYLRNGPYSKDLAGYIWRLEYGLEKGSHFHMAIFFDGQELAKDITIADALGHYWKNFVTGGNGMYFSCNKNKEAYERCGIGMVARNDDMAWANVEEAMFYLTKQDYYLRFRPAKGTRTFGSGGPYGGVQSVE